MGDPETNTSTPVWVPVARLMRAQGRRGELLAEALGDADGLFDEGRDLWLAADESGAKLSESPSQIESSWWPTGRNAGRVVLKLKGCESIEAAEALRGRFALIPEDALPEPEDGAFFVRDLEGCRLFDAAHPETPIGEIEGVEYAVGADGRTRLEAAPDLLQVRLTNAAEDSEPVLIPFVQAWVEVEDVEGLRLVMRLPQGLIEMQRPDDAEERLSPATD